MHKYLDLCATSLLPFCLEHWPHGEGFEGDVVISSALLRFPSGRLHYLRDPSTFLGCKIVNLVRLVYYH